jgi:hypothetical protein
MSSTPRPFVVFQDGRFLFTLHARSLRQARALVAARVVGITVIKGSTR